MTDSPDRGRLVSVVLVTYNPDPRMLGECISSLVRSHYRPLEVVVVDNGSRRDVGADLRGATGDAAGGLESVVLPQGRNLGYARGTNIGIRRSRGEFVFLLNPDTVLDPDALPNLLAAADRHPETAGFAPKVLLMHSAPIIDSVGLAIHANGLASQRGLGQPDAGQYDVQEKVAGLCFAAALVRRAAFDDQRVGLLDDRYFMFYEDVDWSLRSQVLGETLRTVPDAVVHHVHSASTRSLGGGFKTRLIQRNLIWTAVKNLETPSAVRVVIRRTAANGIRAAKGKHSWTSLRAVIEAFGGLAPMLSSRRAIQARRRARDRQFLTKYGEPAFFDADNYIPVPTVETLQVVLSRLYAISPTPQLEQTLLRVSSALRTYLADDPARIAAMVREGSIPIGEGLDWLLRELEAGSARGEGDVVVGEVVPDRG